MRLVALAILAAGLCPGQGTPEFDVVSIRPSRSNESGGGMNPIPDGISARNLSVNTLIQIAYGLKPWEISGGPDWARTARWNVEAKAEGDPSFQKKKEMLRTLLADRFQLQFHRETRRMRIYSLTRAKGGPKLQATASGVRGYVRPRRGLIEGQGLTMTTLAEFLEGSLGQSVTDKTGISGAFDIKLEWTPTEGELDYQIQGYGFDGNVDANGPSIFTAIQGQLGLRLEAGKGPVEVFVIDHIARPSEN
jgi:uncharacterized protein (TIGR03435 family)